VSGESVLELDGVTKVYGEEPPVHALRGVSFPSGGASWWRSSGTPGRASPRFCTSSGRWSGPAAASSGSAAWTQRLSDRELSQLRPREIGFAFQQFFLAEHATVRENVADGLLCAGVPSSERYRLADEALERVGLCERARFKPTKLSGGERQRVAIARALVGRPAIVLADEPTGNLDSSTGEQIMALIEELNGQGATIVLITHEQAIAARCPRRIGVLDGQVVSDTANGEAV
jgi:putative ABC transport system ATP-binding protein